MEIAAPTKKPTRRWNFQQMNEIGLIVIIALLYVAFWLQLESASSAAVSVAILAQPKRGQAVSKAIYRFLGTILGVWSPSCSRQHPVRIGC